MNFINGELMSRDKVIAKVEDNIITFSNENLLPLYLKRSRNIRNWLSLRVMDATRFNVRKLKELFHLENKDDVDISMLVNGATIYDNYWFRQVDSNLTYEEVRFKENKYDRLALMGDGSDIDHYITRTPEFTNIGSFEKCWKFIDGKWWLYKQGDENGIFSKLFICKLSEKLGFYTAHYEKDGDYIRSLDFTDGASVNYEPIYSLVGEDEDYQNCFETLIGLSEDLAKQYLILIWMDTIIFNMDRHTQNFGFLRDIDTGEIISLAPNFDNNVALISRGYPKDVSREKDGLIRFFRDFITSCEDAKEMYRDMRLPTITQEMINTCFDEIDIEVDRKFISEFILNGQKIIKDIIYNDENKLKDEEDKCGLML